MTTPLLPLVDKITVQLLRMAAKLKLAACVSLLSKMCNDMTKFRECIL